MGRISLKLAGIIGALIATEATAQYVLKKYTAGKVKQYALLIAGFVLYGLVGIGYQRMLETGESLALANILWQGATVVIMGTLGYFVFGQKLTTKEVIALVGIVLLIAMIN
jgi:multidrug transporter EmrE-like cation transporter